MSKINKIKLSGTTYDIQDLSATSVVNVTQAEYDALVTSGTVDPTTLYNITDAQAGDLSQYWTSAQTNSAITQAVSGKQDTLSAGTNITIVDNVISATGGGSITIDPTLDSGSTNAVANSAITETLGKYYYARKANNSIYNSPWGSRSSNGCVAFTLEFGNILNPNDSVSSGVWLSKINNKTLFYANNSAPNENYFNLNLVETSAITTSISSSSTDAQVPSAKAVYDQLGGLKLVKLTQSEYDALATKDNSTLYVVTDS